MFGFPVNLQDSGVQKFTNDADNGFPKIQQREVFYSVKDGNWTDATTWQTASGRVGKFPSRFDDVYIKHNVTNDQGFDATIEINNLYISGKLDYGTNGGLFYPRRFYVYGNVQCTGTLDLTNQRTGASEVYTFRVYGYNNRIDNFIPSNGNGFFEYYSTNYIPQPVLSLPYSNVSFTGFGVKYLTGNLSTTGDLIIRTFNPSIESYDNTLDLRVWNLNVGGNLGVGKVYWDLGYGNGTLIRSGGERGNVVVGGLCSVNGYMNLSGCDIEFKNGLTYSSQNNLSNIVTSLTDTWRFTTTANQTMSVGNTLSGQMAINAQIIVGSGVTLNLTRGYVGPVWRFNNSINGVDGTSKLVNQCEIYLQTQTAAENIMRTGIADFTSFANTANFFGNYSATISNNISTFHNLTISGTGTKSLGVNTTINSNLYVPNGTIDFSTYNITINGTTKIDFNPGTIKKSGSGNIIFVGLVTIGNSGNTGGTLDFSGGNPNVEFRNGITGDYSNAVTFKTGTGTWRFTTNNQKLGRQAAGGVWNYDCPILIENIILSVQSDGGGNGATHVFKNSVNGTTAGSSLVNYSTIEFQGATTFMTTGTFDFTTNSNNVTYNTSTSFVVPYGSYWGLNLSGTGSKTLSQNTTCFGNFQTYSPVDFTTYNVDIYGTTSMGYTTMSKSGPGTLIFRGLFNTDPQSIINFSGGNPNVEFRGGLTLIYNGSVNSGTGTWSFTTNNQTLQINAIQLDYQFNCTISIVNINLTMNSNNRTFTFTNPINGTTGTSQLTIAATSTINYQSATQPMATGILDTSTNLNTFIYGNANQDIKGGPTTGAKQVYRNLTLNGGGTKTLQGYVSVQNTYTLTSPATLNNNGFTLTNP